MIHNKAIIFNNKLLSLIRIDLISIILLGFIYSGCEKENSYHNNTYTFAIDIEFNTLGKTKSGYIPDNISDINILVFDENEQLIKTVYLNNKSSTTIQLSYGIKTIAAIANVGNYDLSQYTTLTLLRAAKYNNILGTEGNLIYSGELTHQFSPESKNIIIPLTQMLSKITYVFDKSNLDSQVTISITKIQLMNTPAECYYFSQNTPSTYGIEAIGDVLENCNLEPTNHNNAVPLYMFENMQGTIGTNNNPITKHPGTKENVCTYVEITADYNSPTKTGTIKYKNFLGSNTTNNYDIIRGKHYQETIIFNGTSINETSWRIDISNLEDTSPATVSVTGISLNNTSLQLLTGTQYQLQVTVSPSNATNKECIWSSSDPSVVSVNAITGALTTHNYGSSIITAKSSDGAFEDQCTVNVYDHVTLSVDTYDLNTYNPNTNELINSQVILFLRANMNRPSNMNIVQAIKPYINVNISYSYIVRETTYYENGTLTLDNETNNDYPYNGVKGAHKIISFFYPIEEHELLEAKESVSITVYPDSLYIQNWYVTW